MTELQLRQKVIDVMKSWLGYSESNGKHKIIIDLYNTQKPLPVGYKVKYTDEWCATTITAAGMKAGLANIILPECSCPRMIELYKKVGRWMENDAYKPQIGDIVMYDWDDNGVGDCTGTPEHVGYVMAVNGNTMTIIEGNISNSVATRQLKVNGRYIRGYCLPDYASKADKIEEDDDLNIDKLTNAELIKLAEKMQEALGTQDPANWGDEWEEAMKWAEENGVIKGDEDGNKQYKAFTTRQALALMLYRYSKEK